MTVTTLVRLPRSGEVVFQKTGVQIFRRGGRLAFVDALRRWPVTHFDDAREARLFAARRWPDATWITAKETASARQHIRALAGYYDHTGLV